MKSPVPEYYHLQIHNLPSLVLLPGLESGRLVARESGNVGHMTSGGDSGEDARRIHEFRFNRCSMMLSVERILPGKRLGWVPVTPIILDRMFGWRRRGRTTARVSCTSV